jgi:hypothetical protein
VARKKVVKLHLVRNKRKLAEAKAVTEDLAFNAQEIADNFGEEFAGYALVMWNRAGEVSSAYQANYGAVMPDLVVAVVHSKLVSHVAANTMAAVLKGNDDKGDDSA